MKFEEQFPSLKNKQTDMCKACNSDGLSHYVYCQNQIEKYCLDKDKVEDAFIQLAFQELKEGGAEGLDSPEGIGIVREKALKQMRELGL